MIDDYAFFDVVVAGGKFESEDADGFSEVLVENPERRSSSLGGFDDFHLASGDVGQVDVLRFVGCRVGVIVVKLYVPPFFLTR